MENNNILTGHQWQPFITYGYTHSFWTLHTDTLLGTVIVTILIIVISLYANYILKKKQSVTKFIILQYVDGFKDLLTQTLQSAPLEHLAFIGSLFTFIVCCNAMSFIPFVEEPTRDLNTTLALGLISFCYVQGYAIHHKGLLEYLSDFTKPFFLMLPLNIIGTLTSIISLSFRLFGNIFGGYVIAHLSLQALESSIIIQTIGLFSGFNLAIAIIFGLFEGIIQAFVFAMLTLTYLSMEIVSDQESE